MTEVVVIYIIHVIIPSLKTFVLTHNSILHHSSSSSSDKNYDRSCCDINIVFCSTQFQDNSS